MNYLLYWFLFAVLTCLLVILASYLLLSIIWDVFIRPKIKETMFDKEEYRHQTRNKYESDKNDVEDLTRIERNLKTDFPRVSFNNEVKNIDLEKKLIEKRTTKKGEISQEYDSTAALNGSLVSVNENEKEYEESAVDCTESEETFNSTDPESTATFKAIVNIEKEANRVENEMNNFRGGINDLQYYEINEKFIRMMIALCDLNCENDELRKKKNSVMLHIEQCQNRLKLKSHQVL